MNRTIGGLTAAFVAAASVTAQASDCVSRGDFASLRTAAVQQELMVAAFSCHDVALYNRFVRTHQVELIASDAVLKAYFVRRDAQHSEAGYHAYKTELANSSSVESLRDDDFCARADDTFHAVLDTPVLAEAIEGRHWRGEWAFAACNGSATLAQSNPVVTRPAASIAGDDRAVHPNGDRGPVAGTASSALKTPVPHRALEGEDAL